MNTKFAIIAVLGLALLVSSVSAGSGAPSGAHYNLNIIGVPHDMNDNFNGGSGARIFVDRTSSTNFYVHGGTTYEVRDHDGTDGWVGWSRTDPGIIFPYDATKTPTWRVEIYVRMVGPKGSGATWTSKYFDEGTSTYVYWDSFTVTKDTPSKFSVRTNSLLRDGYQDMLWTLEPLTKYRNCQLRIYLLDGK
jgi:hypothetical protein